MAQYFRYAGVDIRLMKRASVEGAEILDVDILSPGSHEYVTIGTVATGVRGSMASHRDRGDIRTGGRIRWFLSQRQAARKMVDVHLQAE